MKYSTYLKTVKECPFCNNIKTRILIENDGAFLTYALAPYHKYHLLVIPKRHVESIKDLDWEENVCTMALLVASIKVLDKLGHDDCSILMRDSKTLSKSIGHVHWNIIPGGTIEDISINSEVRKLINKKEEKSLIMELTKILT